MATITKTININANEDVLENSDILALIKQEAGNHVWNKIANQHEDVLMNITLMFNSTNEVQLRFDYGQEMLWQDILSDTVFTSNNRRTSQIIVKNSGTITVMLEINE